MDFSAWPAFRAVPIRETESSGVIASEAGKLQIDDAAYSRTEEAATDWLVGGGASAEERLSSCDASSGRRSLPILEAISNAAPLGPTVVKDPWD